MRAVCYLEDTMRGMDQTMFPDAHQMSCELLCMLLEYVADPNAVQEQAVYFTSETKSIADKRSVLQVIHQIPRSQ